MRIVSFLPSGTEICGLLGLERDVVAVTHECDHPPWAKALPKVVRSRYDARTLSQSEIDRKVKESLKAGESLYEIDEPLLQRLKPDLIITQDLCKVCAPSGGDAARALKNLPSKPRVLYLTPRTLEEIFENIMETGRATGAEPRAREIVSLYKEELAEIKSRLISASPRSVFFMEWMDPVFCSGHWIPEMVRAAGGHDALAVPGRDSGPIGWPAVRRADPEIIVIAPCGYHLDETAAEAEKILPGYPGLEDLQAWRSDNVYAVDADGFFVRPGPRVVEGIRILSRIFHPAIFGEDSSQTSRRLFPNKSCRAEESTSPA